MTININLFKGNLNDINIFNKQLDGLDLKLFDKKQLFLSKNFINL